MANANSLEGYAELSRKLQELGDPKRAASALKESVRKPMQIVMGKAQENIARISPGEADLHKTYRGRLVSRGFAERSIVMVVKMSKDKTSASAILGVRKEAFYAVQFHELGTAHIGRNPWLVPALQSSTDESIKAMGDILKKRIERIAKQRAKAAKTGG